MVLDPKFAKVIALMRSTSHAGEQDAARGRAEAMAAAAGMTLDEALALGDAPQPGRTFAGFDDYMEKSEPGWKAERAAEKLARHRAWRARREALIEKYGSTDSAIEPCERERLILTAVARWRQPVAGNPRWTHSLDGWRGDAFKARRDAPAHIVDAIEHAYPLPATFTEAKAEHDYWTDRNRELEDALAEAGTPIGDEELDLPVAIRAEIVRNLAEYEISVTSLQDLHARFTLYRDGEVDDQQIEDALFRDVEALARREREESARASAPQQASVHATGGQIEATLKAHPDWSDRRIARATGCSPTTVGKVRRAIGATASARSVERGGQTYSLRVADAAP